MPHDLLVAVADALADPLRGAGYARRSTRFRIVFTVAPPPVTRWLSRGERPPVQPAVRHGFLCPPVVPPAEFWEGAASPSTDPIWRIDRAASPACVQACVDAVVGQLVPLLATLSQEQALVAEFARPRRAAAVKGFSSREVNEILTVLDTAPVGRVLDLLDQIPHVPVTADFRRTFVAWVHAELAARSAATDGSERS